MMNRIQRIKEEPTMPELSDKQEQAIAECWQAFERANGRPASSFEELERWTDSPEGRKHLARKPSAVGNSGNGNVHRR
jgi:hypothetical protein